MRTTLVGSVTYKVTYWASVSDKAKSYDFEILEDAQYYIQTNKANWYEYNLQKIELIEIGC